jgi:hypothetical protein
MSRIAKQSQTIASKDEPFYADIAQLLMTAQQFATHCVANLSWTQIDAIVADLEGEALWPQ